MVLFTHDVQKSKEQLRETANLAVHEKKDLFGIRSERIRFSFPRLVIVNEP